MVNIMPSVASAWSPTEPSSRCTLKKYVFMRSALAASGRRPVAWHSARCMGNRNIGPP